jgi:hypothetical protein
MKCWPLVVLLAMMAWACSDDDGTKEPEIKDPDPETESPEGKKLLFAITGNVIGTATGYSGWLLISDKQGNVLETAELKNNETHTFEAAESYAEQTVTLTLVRNYPNYTSVYTYAQVPFGEYGLTAATSTPIVSGSTNVTLEDYTDDVFTMSTSGPSVVSIRPQKFELTEAGAELSISTRAKKSKVLFVRNSEPFLYALSELEQNTNNVIHASDFVSADAKDFEIPDTEYAGWQITGVNNDGQFLYYNWVVGRPLVDPPAVRSIPVLSDFFTSYIAVLSSRNGNAADKYSYKGIDVPTSMKYLDGTLTYDRGGNRQVWETTGVADAVKLSVLGVDGQNRADWQVYGGTGSQVVVVPEIPANVPLSGGNMKRSFAELADEYEVTTDLIDYLEYTGYMDVIVKPSLVPGTTLSWKEIVTKQILASIYL